MTIAEARLRNAILSINDNPALFTWGGSEYACLASDIKITGPNTSGGIEERHVIRLTTAFYDVNAQDALVSRFPDDTPPTINDTITFRGHDYQVNEVEQDIWDDDNDRHLLLSYDLWVDDAT